MRALIIENNPAYRDMLNHSMAQQGFENDTGDSLEIAREYAASAAYDIICVSQELRDGAGESLVAYINELDQHRDTPILFLTVRDDIADRVEGLDAGGDDYMTKPFAFDELFARLRALIRRSPQPRPSVLFSGPIELDPASHEVRLDGELLELSPKEFSLLEYLMTRAGDAVSRSEILDHVWDFGYDGTSNVVDVYIGYLRSKLGNDRIETIRGVGYRLAGDGT